MIFQGGVNVTLKFHRNPIREFHEQIFLNKCLNCQKTKRNVRAQIKRNVRKIEKPKNVDGLNVTVINTTTSISNNTNQRHHRRRHRHRRRHKKGKQTPHISSNIFKDEDYDDGVDDDFEKPKP